MGHSSPASKRLAVINVVGLSTSLIGIHTPRITKRAKLHGLLTVKPVTPAVTASTQSTYLTGRLPAEHGVVGNGWYFRDLAQVMLWRQSNHLVHGEKLWEAAKRLDPTFTCANLFWWFNMYSSVDFAVTPRPIYRADGLKLPDIWTHPSPLRDRLTRELGEFPLFQFWGPGAGIASSQWIAEAAKRIYLWHKPNLNLVYLPHLDYCLQREGPRGRSVPAELARVDEVVGDLLDFYESQGVAVTLVSEYGISEVKAAIPINQILRKEGWISVRTECGEEHIDVGASRAFAVADHQIAHVYLPSMPRAAPDYGLWVDRVRARLEQVSGIRVILDRMGQREFGINHERSGDLVAIAENDHWFSYPYWVDERMAPDFAKTVDIHRKPGYDPVELFINPSLRFPRLKMGLRLLQKKLGMRYRMDVIPLDTHLIRGSHGSPFVPQSEFPVYIPSVPMELTPSPALTDSESPPLHPTQVHKLLLSSLFRGFEMGQSAAWPEIIRAQGGIHGSQGAPAEGGLA